jgi:hypothetical protein
MLSTLRRSLGLASLRCTLSFREAVCAGFCTSRIGKTSTIRYRIGRPAPGAPASCRTSELAIQFMAVKNEIADIPGTVPAFLCKITQNYLRRGQTLKHNSNSVFTRLRMLVPLAISLALLPACSSNPFHSEQTGSGKQGRIITVTSTPSGATVRVDGTKLGETPLKVNIDKSFPHKWVAAEDYGIVYRASGKLTIEKSGCDEYAVPVSHTAPAEDINVTLVCKPDVQGPSSAGTAKPVISDDVEQRLKKLDKMYRDGVISAEEYKQHRARILGEL